MMERIVERSNWRVSLHDKTNHPGLIRKNIQGLLVLYRGIDLLLIYLTLLLSISVNDVVLTPQVNAYGFFTMVLFLYLAECLDLYRSWRTINSREMYFVLWSTCIIAAALFQLLDTVLFNSEELSKAVLLIWFSATVTGLSLWRMTLRRFFFWVRSRGYNSRIALIIGATESGLVLAKNLESNPQLGITVVGFYDDRKQHRRSKRFTCDVVGNIELAMTKAVNRDVDLIYIAIPMYAQDRIGKLLQGFGNSTVAVHIIPDLFVNNRLHSSFRSVGTVETLSIYDTPLVGINSWLKRLEDILLSVVILCLVSIPMLIIALTIRLSSRGPILFKQKRYGLCSRQIEVWKFRTMKIADCEKSAIQAIRNDSRVTAVGRFLRRTSLDELPQFFNVLAGTMSVVGPRPHAIEHNEQYRSLIDCYMLRHVVKPGITGWAQVNGFRGETATIEKMQSRVEYDLNYIRNWSLLLDIYIVGITFFSGFTGENAY